MDDEEQIHHVVVTDDMCVKLFPLVEEGFWHFKENEQRTLEIRWETKLIKKENSKS